MASDGARKQFWKRSNSKVPGSIQHVYGAQHPPFDPLLHGTLLKATPKVPTTPVKARRTSTFQEFESNTSDAWDASEDDDELLAMAAESLNTEVVMETANRVLRNHSQRQERRRPPEPPAVPSGDLRLVKSVSESHTSCPAESASDAAPLQRSQSLPHSVTVALGGTSDPSTLSSSALSEREASRLDKFKQLLAGPNTDLEELRKLSWSGIPKSVRPITWKLLSGYLPANVERRPATLQRKQKEYFAFIEHYYDSRHDDAHQDTYRQIHIDIPRMSPEALILQPKVTEIFERILFIWAIRHPASGYVQGINDLVTPFFVVFMCEHIEEEDVDAADVSRVPTDVLRNVEADTYWCMSRLLDGIQDNYTFAQPGIQMKVKMLEELVSRIDGPGMAGVNIRNDSDISPETREPGDRQSTRVAAVTSDTGVVCSPSEAECAAWGRVPVPVSLARARTLSPHLLSNWSMCPGSASASVTHLSGASAVANGGWCLFGGCRGPGYIVGFLPVLPY
ncbi:TBC1 domain family member 22A isoform X3 [Neofelis nebulosa]|uniref:TBC1 domain family member 22A isoform X3 n=1 Tax=Neofelis nebulosa TaxID=61452 RepID=UPI00272B2807|nr:TBC1 domain family member 22A isoform X3 [Neofelis nebulosa]